MRTVGFIGWRGMVGSVLMERMREEGDFDDIEPAFFTTSNVGGTGPAIGKSVGALKDANDIEALAKHDVLVSCQGGDYTKAIHPKLRAAGWNGYWIDAASALRMEKSAVIILDPVNKPVIDRAVEAGVKDYIGGNCTVSLHADGHRRALARRCRRVGECDDLPGRLGRRRAEHARAAAADGRGAFRRQGRCSTTRPPPSSTSIAK